MSSARPRVLRALALVLALVAIGLAVLVRGIVTTAQCCTGAIY